VLRKERADRERRLEALVVAELTALVNVMLSSGTLSGLLGGWPHGRTQAFGSAAGLKLQPNSPLSDWSPAQRIGGSQNAVVIHTAQLPARSAVPLIDEQKRPDQLRCAPTPIEKRPDAMRPVTGPSGW
jgi:hypothetical protein